MLRSCRYKKFNSWLKSFQPSNNLYGQYLVKNLDPINKNYLENFLEIENAK